MNLKINITCDCGNENEIDLETPFLLKIPCQKCGSVLIAEFKSIFTRSEIRRRRFKSYFDSKRRSWND